MAKEYLPNKNVSNLQNVNGLQIASAHALFFSPRIAVNNPELRYLLGAAVVALLNGVSDNTVKPQDSFYYRNKVRTL